MTPNLPDATCFTLEFALSPLLLGTNLSSSSPPSPLHDAPPILFIAIAKVSCASLDKAPIDILPVPNLFLISVTDSTSSNDIDSFLDLKPSRSLRCMGGISWINFEYFLYVS